MSIIKKILLFSSLLLLSEISNAQKIISGKVIDSATNQPIEFATITARSSGRSSGTDKFGNFKILVPSDSSMITVTYLGYATQELCARSCCNGMTFALCPASINLREVKIAPQLNTCCFNTICKLDLNLRPVNSSQDLLRLVPGLFIAQHMGGGKAEQIFLRGFDADHGTDVNISIDGLPVNMVSHIHGQGYADMHYLIPETVSGYDFGKGPYYTNYGDFTTAGYVNYQTKNALTSSMIRLEAGQFNTHREMAMINLLNEKTSAKGQNAYIAGEYNYTDGPFQFAEHYKRVNVFGKYNIMLDSANKFTFIASYFSTSWRASGEIPVRLIDDGSLNRFATIDSLQGGSSNRANIIARLTTDLKNGNSLENQIYYSRYNFRLRVNSTFFAEDSLNGDAVKQREARNLFGYNGRFSHRKEWSNASLTSVAGLGLRLDRTDNSELDHVDPQNNVLSIDQLGNISENNINGFIDESIEYGKWVFNAGTRVDYFRFNYDNKLDASVPSISNVIFSPKLNIEFTADPSLQFYLKTGKGFHSNDTRAVIYQNGLQTLPFAYGTDLGVNWKPLPKLYINMALWYLYLHQEFVFTDDGGVEPGGQTRRIGADFTARYQFTDWLYGRLNVNIAKPRLLDSLKGKGYVALAPTFTSSGGLDFKLKNGINGGLSYRCMTDRPANNDYSLKAKGYYVADFAINYTKKRYEIGLSIENLLNTKWDEYSVEEETKLRSEATPVDGVSITPGTPFFAKLKFSLFF